MNEETNEEERTAFVAENDQHDGASSATQANNETANYLADVLRVWDCDEQRWLGATPIVLRFENEDVLLRARALPDRVHDLVAEKAVAPKQNEEEERGRQEQSAQRQSKQEQSGQKRDATELADLEVIWECQINPTEAELTLDDQKGRCLCWRSDRGFSPLIGRETSTCETCRNIHSALRLHTAEVRFLKLLDTKAGERENTCLTG